MINKLTLAAVFLTIVALPVATIAQEQSRVSFEAGNDNAAINGTIIGDGYIDYLLGAKAGQTMSVSLIVGDSNGTGNVNFNILPPGSSGEAIFNGAMDGRDAIGLTLPADGDYTIRVYHLGDDADSGKTSGFTISVVIM